MEKQTLKINNLVILTEEPEEILRKLDDFLAENVGKDYQYDFNIE